MGKSDGELAHGGEGMLIIVAQNGKGKSFPLHRSGLQLIYPSPHTDDAPDPSTFKAFLASPSQGLTYKTGIWHHSVLTLCGPSSLVFDWPAEVLTNAFVHNSVPTDFACFEAQMSTDGDREEDCEVRRKTDGEPAFLTVEVK